MFYYCRQTIKKTRPYNVGKGFVNVHLDVDMNVEKKASGELFSTLKKGHIDERKRRRVAYRRREKGNTDMCQSHRYK